MDTLEDAYPHLREQMLNLMGVTVVESIDLEAEYGVSFEVREAYPRIRWVACGIQVEDAKAAMDLIRSGSLEHGSEVVLESEVAAKATNCSPEGEASLQVLDEAADSTAVRVISPADGYLVVADTWYPGWQAYVDGVQVQLWRANYLFRAVPVPAGKHEVEIKFQPTASNLGAIISLAAIIMLVVLFVLWSRNY